MAMTQKPCYLYCRMAEETSLSADEVIGRSLYHFCHVNDLTTLRNAHIEGGNNLLYVVKSVLV